jgi:hypothetical protein
MWGSLMNRGNAWVGGASRMGVYHLPLDLYDRKMFFQQKIFGQDGLRLDVRVSCKKTKMVWIKVSPMLTVVVIWPGSSVGRYKPCDMQ